MITTNEMIYKTICTKVTKEPKYKSVLEDLGYEVLKTEWSTYNYWAVKNTNTGKVVLFSKGYDNKKHLYGLSTYIKAFNFKKVDYVNYLKKKNTKTPTPYFYIDGCGKYHELRTTIKDSKFRVNVYMKLIEEDERKISEIKDTLEQHEKTLKTYEDILNEARQKVLTIKNIRKEK